MDWLDVIPVKIPPQPDQDNEQNIPVLPIRSETNLSEIPQLESDIDEEEEGQFEDLQTYLTHHNTYQESQNICKEYRKRLLDLNDDRYYRHRSCVRDLRPNSRPHTSQSSPWTSPYDAGAYTNIWQRKRSGLQGRAPQAPTLWSTYMISAEQNSKKDKENSTHATEICQYAIIFFVLQFNMPIVNDAT